MSPDLSSPAPGSRTTPELLAIAQEMREHKVNHGKHTSPTLIAWAERIEKAAKLPERIVLWSPQPQPLGPDWYFVAERAEQRLNVNGMPVYRTLDPVAPPQGPDPRIEEVLQWLHPILDAGGSRFPPDWAVNIARILTQPRT